MASLAAARMPWRPATIVSMRLDTPRHNVLVLDVPGWPGHRPGQHADVLLTADDGYRAERSYSIAAPYDEPGRVELGITEVDGGEVSSYLVEDARAGDVIMIRGPVGGYFVWSARAARTPLQLVAGGSGVVPLRAIVRAWARAGRPVPARLFYSARSPVEAPYAAELIGLAVGSATRPPDPGQPAQLALTWTYTRHAPEGWTGYRGRVTPAMLAGATWPTDVQPDIYVCGPTDFVESVASTLADAGHEPDRIRTERFG